ncbi:discoidin domain-containing protein [Sunxiuqinia rutila]|uniref:discoidin domain-containing protein n=1 Tax=Sunxiuqinia rutila TaxID=1397841 RepID=UPI003D364833
MNKILLFILSSFFLAFVAGCNDDEDDKTYQLPSQVSEISVEPRIGGVLVSWTIPTDSNYFYVQTRYEKNGRTINTNSSIYTDSVLIDGLINKNEYVFELQTFNEAVIGGDIVTTDAVRPIRRPLDITYDIENATMLELTEDMIETFTQESSEGPKKNLLDGNINTYWHSAWSSGVAPLPHYIQVTFAEVTKLGGMHYTFRQNGDNGGRPDQFDLQVSEDGIEWETVWVSSENLPTTPVDDEKTLTFGKNHESRYFRIRIISNPGNKTYTHLSTIHLFSMGERIIDLEEEAEKDYR